VTRPHGACRAPGRSTALLLEGLLVALVSVLCAAWALQLWRADLSLPLRYTPVDDTKFYLMLVKGIVEHGSYLSNPSLGAPFGQRLLDYPQGADNLNLLLIRALAVFSGNPALVVNLFFLLSFALASFTAHLVLRSLGVGARAAAVVAVLYSLLSYHFFRGESQLLLSAYYAVPLAAWLFLKLLADAPLLSSRPGAQGSRAWVSRRTVATILICVVIGSDNLYYATFAAVMLLAGSVVVLTIGRRRAALQGLAVVALIAATLAANLAPSLLYRAEHGTNSTLERSAAFTEHSDEGFALRLSSLILPAPESRIEPLRHLAAKYDHAIAPGYCETCYASLGSVGTVGFLWLVLGALGALVGAGGWFAARSLLRHASVGVALALAIGTVGGISSLIEVFLTPDIRAWNRISVFIAFLSLLSVAMLLDALLARCSARRRWRLLANATLVAVLAFGVYDQTNPSFVPAYAATSRQWRSDARFVAEIQARLPAGASVFQLPYVPFPEGYPETPVGDQVATYSTKYEALRGYLHSSTLRWSYGAIKGRPADWPAQLRSQPLSYLLPAVTAAGFEGLWVDPSGFEPAKALAIRAALERLLAEQPLISPDGELWFFDLRPYLTRLRAAHPPALLALLREQTLYPVRAECARDGGLVLVNPSSRAQPVTVTAHLARVGSATAGSILPGTPDGQASDIPASSTVVVRRRLLLASGSSTLQFPAVEHGDRSAGQVLYATVTSDDLTPFATATPGAGGALVPGLTGPPCEI
jgi:phosphoglycerol transferase